MNVNPARNCSRRTTGPSAALLLCLAGCAGLPAIAASAPATPADDDDEAMAIERGIVFNELGDFDAAMQEFNAVLEANPDNADALYEAAITQYSLRDYPACIEYARRGARLASERAAAFELLLGNALDEAGQTRDAIDAYRRSIAIDDTSYLAHFNLAVTLARNSDTEGARHSVQLALTREPGHASGHLLLARLYHYDGFRVPAILAYARFLLLEASTGRSAEAADALRSLLDTGASVSRTDSQVTLALMQANPDLSEGDFRSLEMALNMLQGLQNADDEANRTSADLIADRFELLFGMLSEEQLENDRTGFAWSFYAPYFAAIETMDFTKLVTYFTLRASAIPEVDSWLDDNHGKVNQFLAWSAGWRWLEPEASPERL